MYRPNSFCIEYNKKCFPRNVTNINSFFAQSSDIVKKIVAESDFYHKKATYCRLSS